MMRLVRCWSAIIVALVAAGCASVSVKNDTALSPLNPAKLPRKIFVRPFTFSDNIRVDRTGVDLATFQHNLSAKCTENLALRLGKKIAPAVVVSASAILPRGNYWMVTGEFERVRQGSRLLRVLIGMGAGGTKLDTRVTFATLSGKQPQPFLRIETTGGSNFSPGAITGGVGFYQLGMVLNGLGGLPTGLSYDAVRTSREVNAAVSENLAARGALPENKVIYAKKLGHWPHFWPFPAPTPRPGSLSVTPVAKP